MHIHIYESSFRGFAIESLKTTKSVAKSASELDFVDALEWESWLRKNHHKSPGVWVVFPKKSTNEPTISFEEALDIALAYGWIDISIRKIDERKFGRKFTPRRENSSWSQSNIQNVARLKKEGKMTIWGFQAFQKRKSS